MLAFGGGLCSLSTSSSRVSYHSASVSTCFKFNKNLNQKKMCMFVFVFAVKRLLYMLFFTSACDSFMDRLIQRYDVYKVETISSVYMCVSGIPIRNGQRHVTEIARMSLAIIDSARRFHIASMPEVRLSLRIGAHTG